MNMSLRCGCATASDAFIAIELADELQALQCEACAGTALSLHEYQSWRVRSPQPLAADIVTLLFRISRRRVGSHADGKVNATSRQHRH